MSKKRKPKNQQQVAQRMTQSDPNIHPVYNLEWVNEAATFTATSLTLRDNLSYDEWADVGLKIARVKRFTTWALADWLNYGHARYGETFSQAADATGFQPSYLATIKWVGAAIESSRRREKLSFTHHRAVAKLSPADQDKFLELAEKNDWSREQLEIQVYQHSSKPVELSQVDAERPQQDEAPPPDKKPEQTFLTVDEVENRDERARAEHDAHNTLERKSSVSLGDCRKIIEEAEVLDEHVQNFMKRLQDADFSSPSRLIVAAQNFSFHLRMIRDEIARRAENRRSKQI